MSAEVRDILKRIDALPEQDQLLVHRHLSEVIEAAWQEEVATARELARQRGLTQEDIDRAVEKGRWPGAAECVGPVGH